MNNINNICENTAVALGIFDGIHLGHQKVINKMLEFCDNGLESAIFTFNSDTLIKKHDIPFRPLYTNSYKLKKLSDMKIKYCYCPDFSEIADMTAEDFAKYILSEKMKAKQVVCGKNFRFGKNAVGDFNKLCELGKIYGFNVTAVEPVLYDGERVSSSSIRRCLENGDIEKANILLGGEYEIHGKVVYGRQLGRTIDFPTINQTFSENQLVPCYAVYASETLIDGKKYNSITNIGVKPTVDENIKPLAETHIIDFSDNLYDKEITVNISKMIRKERKFSSVDELKKAICNDIVVAGKTN